MQPAHFLRRAMAAAENLLWMQPVTQAGHRLQVGGSITAGQGTDLDGMNTTWVYRLERLVNDLSRKQGYGAVQIANGGAPASTSQYMSVCLKRFVPENADIVFVEYAR
jgi:hypothetical protein